MEKYKEVKPSSDNRVWQTLAISSFDKASIIQKHVDLSRLKLDKSLIDKSSDPLVAFRLKNIFTPEECKAMIRLSEDTQFTKAPLNLGGGREEYVESVRSCSRVMFDDQQFVKELWNRISPFIPKNLRGAEAVGLNERLRFLKYTENQYFAPHRDGSYTRPDNQHEMSFLTIQMYLNEDFKGGETTFLPSYYTSDEKRAKDIPIKPKTGMALVFSQKLCHEGSILKRGVKYTLRTDIMYRYDSNKP